MPSSRSVTFGVETRTNWNEHSSRTVAAGGSVTAAPNDHIIWAFPEPGNGVSVYLPDLTTNPISRTIIVRDFSGDNTATTTVYNVNATDTVTISAHESAVFDWCPEQFEWYPR